MRADLHLHSTASDGSLPPRALVELALRAGLSHVSITDHDSVDGLDEALTAARTTGLTVIPGVELSALEPDGTDVHVLGYGIDPADRQFRDVLADLRSARLERAAMMIESLSRGGFPISLDDVLAHSRGGAVGRSHVARALVAAGHAASVASAFDRLIGRGRPHYIPKCSHTAREAIRVIHDAGGLAVVAHPGVNDLAALVTELADEGLDGIEAYHADHTPAQRDSFAALAASCGLLCTGGSDFHALDGPNPALGSVEYPRADFEDFLAAYPGC